MVIWCKDTIPYLFVTNRKNFQADEELYNEGMKTLQQRKEDNLKMLKEYKVI